MPLFKQGRTIYMSCDWQEIMAEGEEGVMEKYWPRGRSHTWDCNRSQFQEGHSHCFFIYTDESVGNVWDILIVWDMVLGFSRQAFFFFFGRPRDLGFTGVNSEVAQTDGIPQESTVVSKASTEFPGTMNSTVWSATLYCSHQFHTNSPFCPSFFLLWLASSSFLFVTENSMLMEA